MSKEIQLIDLNQSLEKIHTAPILPFEVRTYSSETIAAFEEAEILMRDSKAKTYSSFAEILSETEAELANE